MQIVRTLLWVLLLIAILAFSFGNWDKQIDVRIWPGMVWDTRVPALVVVSFLLGLVPMWLYHRGVRWRQARRISALETATTRMATPKPRDDHTATPVRPAEPRPEIGSDRAPHLGPEPTPKA